MLHEYCAMNIALWILLCEDLLCGYCSARICSVDIAARVLLRDVRLPSSGSWRRRLLFVAMETEFNEVMDSSRR